MIAKAITSRDYYILTSAKKMFRLVLENNGVVRSKEFCGIFLRHGEHANVGRGAVI